MSKTQPHPNGSDVPAPYLYNGVVKPAWVDDNGHMNVAYYMSAFDDGGEVFFADPGIGWEYTREKKGSVFIVSSKVDYQGELLANEAFRVATRLLDFNPKMLHVHYEISKSENQRMCATAEILYMHISFETRRSAAMPERVQSRLRQIHAVHRELPRPEGLGVVIGIRS